LDPCVEPVPVDPLGEPHQPAVVYRDLVAYAEVFARQNGQKIDPAKLVAPMLARFMSSDRAFLRARRESNDAS
jgi:hypothetical protein